MRYKLYNILMHSIHMVIITSSVFGFLFTYFLIYYLILQVLILCSWLGYGLYDKRWGRCVITEIQWKIKHLYDKRPQTESYIQYWIKHKFKIDTNESNVDKYVTVIYTITFLLGILRYFVLLV